MNEENIIANGKPISPLELDQLKEVVNIGASHASTALSQMIGVRVVLTVPEVLVDKVENISKMIGNENETITAVVIRILGDAPGIMAFLFPRASDEENDIIKLVAGDSMEFGLKNEEYDISVLKEIGNILTGACLTAFSKFLSLNMIHSVSETVTDMLGSVINSVMAEMGQKSDEALIFRVAFTVAGKDIKPQMYFFIDPSVSDKIIELTSKKIA